MAPAARPSLTSSTASTPRSPNPAALLIPGGISLLIGINAGLVLGELPAPLARAELAERHGILMVLGFLGTLIALERAVALRRPWGYAAPALLGAGGLVLALGGSAPAVTTVGAVLLIDGCLAFLAVYAALFTRQRDEMTAVAALGAASALVAAVLWLRLDVFDLLPWLVGFVVLTIASERVELARLHRPAGSERTLLLLASLVFVATAATLVAPDLGTRVFGLAVLVLTLWTAVGDVARRTIRTSGLPRYSAAAMLLGYGWLVLASVMWVVSGRPDSRAAYDLVVHAVFLGFAMSMVLAHAPIILPAVIRRPLPYHPVLWALLLFLQGALVLRLGIGDLLGRLAVWEVGTVLTAAALVLLPVVAATLVLTAAVRRRPAPRPAPGHRRTPEPHEVDAS